MSSPPPDESVPLPGTEPPPPVDPVFNTVAPTLTRNPGVTPGRQFDLRAGSRPLPDFELIERLGKGGFGEVWKARQPSGLETALKFVRLGDNAAVLEQKALDAIMNIRHPHLLALSGIWQRDDYLILAMELADGTLMDRLKQALAEKLPGVPRAELLGYLHEAAKGLDHLNNLKVQHRDVKPQNLMLVGGCVKVGDFGLARVMAHSLTNTTDGGFTLAYAAPELLKKKISDRCDQYALAVSYCQLRANRLPFDGTMSEMVTGILMDDPDLSMLPEVERPPVARALAKAHADRWPSCRDFVRALEEAVRGESDTERLDVRHLVEVASTGHGGQSGGRGRGWLLAVATVAVLAAAGVAGGLWLNGQGGPKDGMEAGRTGETLPAPGLHLTALAPVKLRAGQSQALDVQVQRDNCRGDARVQVEGLPPGVTCAAVNLPDGEATAHLTLQASADAASADRAATVRVTLGQLWREEPVRVLLTGPPSLKLVGPADVPLQAGGRHTLLVKLERKNLPAPVALSVTGLPDGVRAQVGPVAAEAATAEVQLSADAGVAAGEYPVHLEASADGARDAADFRLVVRRPEAPAPKALKTIENSLKMKLVLIPAGTFRMGAPENELDRREDETAHEVTLTRPFYLGAHEVTVRQFREFVQDRAYHGGREYLTEPERDDIGGAGFDEAVGKIELHTRYSWKKPGFPQKDDHPVVNVTWRDAHAFCAWLSKKEGKVYTLPTEAEWEYACRAGTTTRYCGGDADESLRPVANAADQALRRKFPAAAEVASPWDDGQPFTAPVGSFKPNGWGLYDMHGNVWEWCNDEYDRYETGRVTDPVGPAKGDGRVLRGGSWINFARACRSAVRFHDAPAYRNNDVGFRVVLRPAGEK